LDFKTLKKIPALQLAYQISQELRVPAYLVGGAVRDALMGFFYGKDFDFVLGEKWRSAARLFALKAHGTLIPWDCNQIRIVVREAGTTITVDFTGFRVPGIMGDLRERDFTINSMALSVASLFQDADPVIYDPLGGRNHLQEKVLQSDGDASFDQDPLRILRAIRFSRAFNFRIEDKTKSLMREKAQLLTGVARERVKRELFAIFNLPGAEQAIKELAAFHIIHHLLPDLQPELLPHSLQTVECLAAIMDHPESVADSHAAGIQAYLHEYIEAGVITRRALLLCAALLHDCGKSSDSEGIRPLCPGRESVNFNQKMVRRLLLGRKAHRILATITQLYIRMHQMAECEEVHEQAMRRFLCDTEEAPIETVLLALAVMRARGLPKAADRVMQLTEKVLALLFAVPAGDLYQQLISGEDIMAIMNLPPGEMVGKILSEIHDGERDGRFNNREEVLEWLKKRQQLESG
jgi:poly(A) polymerase